MNTNNGRIYVLAATHRDFMRFCSEFHLSPTRVTYISNEEKILGLRKPRVVFLEGWWLHPRAYEISKELHLVGFEEVNQDEYFT
jgi:hypothetical protein